MSVQAARAENQPRESARNEPASERVGGYPRNSLQAESSSTMPARIPNATNRPIELMSSFSKIRFR